MLARESVRQRRSRAGILTFRLDTADFDLGFLKHLFFSYSYYIVPREGTVLCGVARQSNDFNNHAPTFCNFICFPELHFPLRGYIFRYVANHFDLLRIDVTLALC